MLMELGADGKSRFTSRRGVSVKHAAPLNLAVGRFLKDVHGEREIRVVGCIGGGRVGQVGRVVPVLAEFWNEIGSVHCVGV